MILIFSENNSYSTRYVTRHLYKMKQSFDVFLETDYISYNYELDNKKSLISIHKNGRFLCYYHDIKSVWAHRSDIQILHDYSQTNNEYEKEYLLGHFYTQRDYIRYLLHQKKCLGRFGNLNFNKLIFLDTCRKLNLKIPKSLVTRKKSELNDFYINQNHKIIVKSIAVNYHFCIEKNKNEQIWAHGITSEIDNERIKKIPDEFDLSLFQEKLDKKYELRVLFIDGICYAQVIFSQKYSFSKIDYRVGLDDKKMRQCGYKLPMKIIIQINKLMSLLNLNIGCIDIVVTKSGDFVFLEVNPSGIFTDMMDNCNYDMHYDIAKYLTL